MINLPHERLPEWESHDASALQAFLESPTGRKVIPLLIDGRPSLEAFGSMAAETVALQARVVQGYEMALVNLSRLIAQPEKAIQPEDTYPPLEDDSKWPKGLGGTKE